MSEADASSQGASPIPSLHGTNSRTSQEITLTTSANVKEAERYRDLNAIREYEGEEWGKPSVFWMTPQDLGKYGVGLELYFSFLKRASVLFLIMSAISVWPLLLNRTGGYLKGVESIPFFDNLTLANQGGKDFSNDDLESAEDSIDDNRKYQIMTLAADVINTLLFTGFLIYARMMSARAINRNLEQNLRPNYFALEVKGIPPNAREREVEEHFAQFGEVVEVSLARRYKGALLLYKKRLELNIKLEIEKKKCSDRGETTNEKILDLKARIAKFDIDINKKDDQYDLHHDDLPVIKAYVVFNRTADRKNCYEQYRNARHFCQSKRKQPTHLKFQRTYSLKVKRPPEPSNILWENLEVKSCSRRLRKLFAFACALAVLIASFALMYWLKLYGSELPMKQECSVESQQDLLLEEAEVQYTEDGQIECWCLLEGITSVLQSSKKRMFCSEYISLWQLSIAIRVLSAAGIIVINYILKCILQKVSRIERVSTVTKEQRKIMFKIFIAMFVNTAFINLVVNADFQDFTAMQYVPFKKYMFDGEFDDFTRGWYMRVGSVIVITMLFSMVFPSFLDIFVKHPYKKFKMCFCRWHCKTQHELNQLYLGAKFDIAGKTAIALNILFSCFLYSGGIPLLNVICFCSLFFLYWIEKYLIVHYYRKPPVYDHGLNQRVMSLLPYAILLHCGFSLYMYGSGAIWPLEYTQDADGFIVTVKVSFIDRLTRYTSITLIAIMGLIFFVLMFSCLRVKVERCFRPVRVAPPTNALLTFQDGMTEMKHRGVASYYIHENPRYTPIVKSLNECVDNRRMIIDAIDRSVRSEVSLLNASGDNLLANT